LTGNRVRRLLGFIGVVMALAIAAGASAPFTLARLTDQDASTGSFSTDTLAPPTSLAATGGLSASLTWTASADTYSTGYEVWRSTTSGSSYAYVKTITPGTATSGSDSPPTGIYYYVLRSAFQNWRSVNSNEASAIVAGAPTATGYKACGSTAADTGGDGDGYELNSANACADDGVVATDANTGTALRSTSCTNIANDRHRFRDFTLGVPATVTAINGIQVRADVGQNNNGGTSVLCAELSGDGGLTWTPAQTVTLSGSAQATYGFGGVADTWGQPWTEAMFSNTNFRVRLTDATNQNTKDYHLDFLAVQVTYIP
jgi:hypothetical protein